jgi:hypothetical protein
MSNRAQEMARLAGKWRKNGPAAPFPRPNRAQISGHGTRSLHS